MATESLVVELDARTKKLEAKLTRVDKKLTGVGKKGKGAGKSLGGLAGIAIKTGKTLINLATTAVALSAAIGAIATVSAKSRRELDLLAAQAKTSSRDFQALAFATTQYGINAEKIADISKDISDRVGEFSAAGTGTFQDYADVMKMTKKEAQEVAIGFQSLSSEQVIGKMVSEMEAAGVTGSKMTFVLESMGNDLSKLKPLFSANSAELNKLKSRFNEVNDSLQITAGQADKLKGVATTFDLLTAGLGNAATAISATIAPVVDDFFNDVIDIVPEATQTIIDFVNSFLDAENITSIAGVNKEIETSLTRIAEKEELIRTQIGHRLRGAKSSKNQEEDRLAALREQLVVLEDQEKLADARRNKGGEIGGAVGGEVTGIGTGDQIQAIADRFKAEEDLLFEKLERELVIIGDNNELKLSLEEQYLADVVQIEEDAADKKKKIADDELKLEKKIAVSKRSLALSNATALISIGSSLFSENEKMAKAMFIADKAVAVSNIFINTQAAAVKSLTIDPTGVMATGIETNGYIRMAAVAASVLGGISGGGGSSIGGGNIPTQTQKDQEQFQPETSRLNVSDSSEEGSRVFNINVPDGDEIGEAIANWLNKAQSEGRV